MRVGKDESVSATFGRFFKCNLIPDLFSKKILTKNDCKHILGEIAENAVNIVNIKKATNN